MQTFDFVVAIVKVIVIFSMILSFVPILIWMERKGAAYIQDRRGPNRAAILGIRMGGVIHSIADAIKLFTKEEIALNTASKPLFYFAPVIAFFVAIVTIAVIPFAAPVEFLGHHFTLQIADLDAGLIYIFAMSSIGVYALIIAGWSACGKYPFLGALRAAAQMVSYEIALGLSVVCLFLMSGSLRLQDIVANQGNQVWHWNFIRQPLAFILFVTALFAETNRLPFDMPEGESEIVAGYHTEYSSMRFALFFMGEYTHVMVGSLIISTLFFGGFEIPFVSASFLKDNINRFILVGWPAAGTVVCLLGWLMVARFKRRFNDARDFETLVWGLPMMLSGLGLIVAWTVLLNNGFFENLPAWIAPVITPLLQIACLFAKAIFFAAFFIWIRWTLPRFRYDQLMNLGWKVMIPLGIANVIITSAVMAF